MAKEKGIYEKYGLDVNIIHGGYEKEVTEYLQEGKADFGTIYLTTAILERFYNINLVNIGQVFQKSGIVFIARKDSSIHSIEDFSGKKIAVWLTVLKEMTFGFLNKNHIYAEVIQINEGVNIFLKGAVDICVGMYYNEYNRLLNFGLDPDELSVFFLNDYEMDFPEDGIYCMEETYQKDPELCANFVKASMEGWKYAFSHQEETVQVIRRIQIQEKIPDNLVHLTWMLKEVEQLMKPAGEKVGNGELLKSDYVRAVKFLLDEKMIDAATDYNDFYKGYGTNERQ